MSDTEAPSPRTHARRRPFARPLGECITPVAESALKKRGFSEMTLFKEWPNIVGKKCAARCVPEKISTTSRSSGNAVLHIRAAGNWALELQHMEPVILERIATYFGYRAINRIVITQGLLPAATAPSFVSSAPLPAQKAHKIDALVAEVADATLRESLKSLGAALAKNNKLLKDE